MCNCLSGIIPSPSESRRTNGLPFPRLPPVFLPSPPQMQAGVSLSSLGLFTEVGGGGRVLVLFESLLDKSKGRQAKRGDEAFLGVHQTSMQHLTCPKGNPFISRETMHVAGLVSPRGREQFSFSGTSTQRARSLVPTARSTTIVSGAVTLEDVCLQRA